MTVRFTVGSLPGQIPEADFIQDSIFGGVCEIVRVEYNANNLLPIYWLHEPSESRLYWGDEMIDGDDILVTVNKLG